MNICHRPTDFDGSHRHCRRWLRSQNRQTTADVQDVEAGITRERCHYDVKRYVLIQLPNWCFNLPIFNNFVRGHDYNFLLADENS